VTSLVQGQAEGLNVIGVAEFPGGLAGAGFVARGDDDVTTGLGQGTGHVVAQPGVGASDNGDAAVESKEIDDIHGISLPAALIRSGQGNVAIAIFNRPARDRLIF
jgi:hypothetical protein